MLSCLQALSAFFTLGLSIYVVGVDRGSRKGLQAAGGFFARRPGVASLRTVL
jgi:hypothetical protein